MTPPPPDESTRWQRIQEIFHAVASAPAEQRTARLAELCGDDEALRAEVALLLDGDAQSDTQIRGVIRETFAMASAERDARVARDQIGPYRVLRELGRGGMSTVYLAERADQEYRKQVAIKVIRRGLDTDDIRGRLRLERQILANLEHPNISRFLEGGTTGDGLPYFVMEYIEGEPVDQYCDRHALSIDHRLALFRQICAAVHHAHQHLVIHRDLKPSNILITASGEPKLLDFGIAKLLEPERFPEVAAPTAIGTRLLTPAFASPEQIRGLPLTTATDVYSLGMLLYLLLAGRMPYRLPGGTDGRRLEELGARVDEVTVRKLSTAVRTAARAVDAGDDGDHADRGADVAISPERIAAARDTRPQLLRRRLAGDLDNIVATALRKEAARRYPSVEGLSEDLRRHLAGLPVIARGDGLRYRAWSFAKRHRIALGTAGAVLALVVAIVGFYTAQLTRQRDRAQYEAAKAAEVSSFVIDLFEVSDPSRSKGREVTARELLERGAERIERELSAQPALRAGMMDTIGITYQKLGLFEESLPLLRQAVALKRQTHGSVHLEVASSLAHLGHVAFDLGDADTAKVGFGEALAIRRELLGSEHETVAESLNDLAVALDASGEHETARPMFEQALAIQERALGPEHLLVAETSNNLGALLYDLREIDEAVRISRRALRIRRQILGNEHPLVALTLSNLSVYLQRQGALDEAGRLARESLAIRRQILGNEHQDLAVSLNNLANIEKDRGKLREAEALYREALTITRSQRGDDYPQVSGLMMRLAKMLAAEGDLARAEPLYRDALTIRRRNLEPQDWGLSSALLRLGQVLLRDGRPDEALPFLREAAEIRRQTRPDHSGTAEAEESLAAVYSSSPP